MQKILKIIGVIIVIRMLATFSLVLGLGLFAGACTQQENAPTGETQPGTTTTEPMGTEAPGTAPGTENSPTMGGTESETPGTPEASPLPGSMESPTPSEPEATPSPDAT